MCSPTLHETPELGTGGHSCALVWSLPCVVGWEERDLLSSACCWPHPGGTIFTHLNSPSQPPRRLQALGLVTDLMWCSGHSLRS